MKLIIAQMLAILITLQIKRAMKCVPNPNACIYINFSSRAPLINILRVVCIFRNH